MGETGQGGGEVVEKFAVGPAPADPDLYRRAIGRFATGVTVAVRTTTP